MVGRKRTLEEGLLPAHCPSHPGMILADIIERLGVSKTQVAEALDITRPSIYGVLSGRWGVTAEMAVKLSFVFGSSATFWMNLQRNYDLWHALKNVDTSKLTSLRGRE